MNGQSSPTVRKGEAPCEKLCSKKSFYVSVRTAKYKNPVGNPDGVKVIPLFYKNEICQNRCGVTASERRERRHIVVLDACHNAHCVEGAYRGLCPGGNIRSVIKGRLYRRGSGVKYIRQNYCRLGSRYLSGRLKAELSVTLNALDIAKLVCGSNVISHL